MGFILFQYVTSYTVRDNKGTALTGKRSKNTLEVVYFLEIVVSVYIFLLQVIERQVEIQQCLQPLGQCSVALYNSCLEME